MDNDTSEQLIALQISVAHLEDTIERLDNVIAQQDKHIQAMQRQLQLLYKHIEAKRDDDGIAPFDLLADRPPHY